jgi:hypothetical protein
MIELLGRLPKKLWQGGKYSRDFFHRKGELRNITDLEPWGLEEVLVEKYKMARPEAKLFASFLLPMLDVNPATRTTAAEVYQYITYHHFIP